MAEMTGVRARNRAQVEAALVAAGRAQLAEVGAAALSVRAVARDMGMAPSALFRYIANRDDLLTVLIADAYGDLAAAVEAVEGTVPRADLRGRWRAFARGVRDWAVAHPHEWSLLFGSPVPGYHAPAQATNEPGERITGLLVGIGVDLQAAGPTPPAIGDDGAELARRVAGASDDMPPLDPVVLTHGLVAWLGLIGAVNGIVFETLGAELAASGELFEYAVRSGERLLFGTAEGE